MDHDLMLQRAQLGAEWMLANQVATKTSADRGRFARSVDSEHNTVQLASSWLQGVGIVALLALHEKTGRPELMESIEAAAKYIRTLQRMDGRDPLSFGYLVETTPQDRHGHPRDALTAAWAMLMIHRANDDEELFDRALLFANWFIRYGMDNEYPYWTVYMDTQDPPLRQRGSFHGGSPAFFNDLFEMTGDERWLKTARKIADFHIAHLLNKDGSLKIIVEADTNRDLTGQGVDDTAWEHMHKFNDDFTALAMLRLGELTEAQKYTEAGLRFARHLLRSQQDNGGFGDPPVPSASPTGAITLVRAAQVDTAGADEYLAAAERAVGHILSLQEIDSDSPKLRGGFYGQADLPTAGGDWRTQFGRRTTIHMRTHAYCTAALAMIGGRCRQTYYNVACG